MSGSGADAGKEVEAARSNTVPGRKKRSRKTADIGSPKKSKKKCNLIDEVDSDGVDYFGVERKSVEFQGGEDRHLLLQSGMVESANSIVVLRKKPFWFKECDSWIRGLPARGLKIQPIVVDGKSLAGI